MNKVDGHFDIPNGSLNGQRPRQSDNNVRCQTVIILCSSYNLITGKCQNKHIFINGSYYM